MPTFIIKGKPILIDEIDIPLLESRAWYWTPQGYLCTSIQLDEKYRRRTVGFHRLALGDPPSECVDHINRDKSDNRRFNLRPCSYRQNRINSEPCERGGKGVTFNTGRDKWQVVVRSDGGLKWLGYFKKEDDARAVAKDFFDNNHNPFRS